VGSLPLCLWNVNPLPKMLILPYIWVYASGLFLSKVLSFLRSFVLCYCSFFYFIFVDRWFSLIMHASDAGYNVVFVMLCLLGTRAAFAIMVHVSTYITAGCIMLLLEIFV